MQYIWAIVVVLIAGILLAVLLALADKYLKVEEDPRKGEIRALLPGVDCGACGYPGCSGLAQAMAEGTSTQASDCKVIKGDKKDRLQEYLDDMKKCC